jgi:translation initiation factor 2 subunit 1
MEPPKEKENPKKEERTLREIRHRFYENKFPKSDDVVMCQVININEYGVFVKLLEYENMNGFVTTSELSQKRFSSIAKIIKVNQRVPLIVLHVDEKKKDVDLSKRKLSRDETKICEDKFSKLRNIYFLIIDVCCKLPAIEPIETYVKAILHQSYENHETFYDNIITNPEQVTEKLDTVFKTEFINEINRRRIITPSVVELKIEIKSYSETGVTDIKNTLLSYQDFKGLEDYKIEAKIITPPSYYLRITSSKSSKDVMDILRKILKYYIHPASEKYHTSLVVHEPTIISQSSIKLS